jgi:hypothetical protein
MHVIRLSGLQVRSYLPLPGVATGETDVDLELLPGRGLAGRPFVPDGSTRRFVSAGPGPNQTGAIEFHEQSPWRCLRCVGLVDFYFTQPQRLWCFPTEAASADLVTGLIAGAVCALVHELRGVPCLHASAVAFGDRALALMAASGTGKSSLAAQLVSSGGALLCDDIVPLQLGPGGCCVVPGYPQVRLGPEAAALFAGSGKPVSGTVGAEHPSDRSGKRFLTPFSFRPTPTPLAVAYVLERDPDAQGPILLRQLGPTESLIELVRFSYCARLVEKLGLQARRLPQLAEVLRHTRVRHLRIPSDLQRLGEVHEALARDLEALP